MSRILREGIYHKCIYEKLFGRYLISQIALTIHRREESVAMMMKMLITVMMILMTIALMMIAVTMMMMT